MKVVSLWSGGKDSCLACYKAQQQGCKVLALFNFIQDNGNCSLSHGLLPQLIKKQTDMTGIPFLQIAMPRERYTDEFKRLITKWKLKRQIEGIVFGDIYLKEHKDWIDRVCAELGVEAIMPLWSKDTLDLVNEFIREGFQSLIVATQADLLGKEWLGRKVDSQLVKEFKQMGSIDFCGEKGEFHTFVYNGPLFNQSVEFTTGKSLLKDKHWFLEVA